MVIISWPSKVRGWCDEQKMGQIKTMKTNRKRRKDLRLVTWIVRLLYRPKGLRITINELRKYKIAIAAIQETRWNESSNGYNIYTSSLANYHEFGTAFLVDSKFNHMVKNFVLINERLCVIRIKGRFFNYSLINIHVPKNDSEELNFPSKLIRLTKVTIVMCWVKIQNDCFKPFETRQGLRQGDVLSTLLFELKVKT
jgi:hypothetical protein